MNDCETTGGFVAGLADARGFRLLFLTIFTVVLMVALLSQLTGRPWRRWLPGASRHATMLAGVCGAVHAIMPFLVEPEGGGRSPSPARVLDSRAPARRTLHEGELA
ncbi:MAG: hypothetical protein WCJ69_04550 [Betaproteobacteria bacterium]|jgi:hypothetical protein